MLCRWLPPSNHDNAPVVLYFNGNGGNISNCDYLADQLQTHLKCGVFLMDYPGDGKSSGSPSEAGCYANATAAIDWLVNERKIPAERIVLMGQSLGGGTAVEMATKYHVRALVLVSTYSSLPAAAKSRFPFLPTYWLMSNRFDSLSKIGTITAPVFIVHGTDDRTIPFSQGETLFQTANEPKQFLRLEGNGHTGCMTIEMMRTLDQFLNQNPNSKN